MGLSRTERAWNPGDAFKSPSRGVPREVLLKSGRSFLRGVDDSGGEESCWPWTRGTLNGNGRFRPFVDGKSTHYIAHYFGYELFVGPVPEGSFLHHTCRNKLCCNPKHLVVRDQPQGAEGLLSDDDVAAIRRRLWITPAAELAREYGVSAPVILGIKKQGSYG